MSSTDTDRNLLFVVLALQSRLIDRDRFIQACTLWATHKDVPIADLLVGQGWLTPAARGLVEQLLALNLAQHGDDVGASLAAAAGAEARGALASLADADVEQSLAALRGSSNPPVAADPFVTVPPSEPEGAGRNILFEEIGRGGMGRVLRGRDNDLRRELAVKVLREEYGGNAEVERRFVEEAQIGGQLQHPGVVPVYELGRFPDRRPFFTMKLVKGQTLAALLKDRPDVAHARARFLTIFEQVCQTLAYAHSKGVIHRDLKPSNVMVGAFGEVQVMDWGLAKVLARPHRVSVATTADPSVLTARDDAMAEGGRTGVIGTPEFMPPEQARGDGEAADERADVFGLGGILSVILTGQPPFVAANREEKMRKAVAGDVAEAVARLDGCGADAELVTLCKECLAPDRQDRPREAGEVAARVGAYAAAVQERLHAAELERTAAEARAEEEARTRRVAEAKAAVERRARRLTVGLAAAVLLAVVVGGSGAWWAQHERQARETEAALRRQQADGAVAPVLSEARRRFDEAWAAPLSEGGKFREALATAQKADELARTGGASEELRQEAADLAARLGKEAAAADRDRRLLVALLEVRGPREGPKFQRDDKGSLMKLAEPSADEQFKAAFRDWDPTFDVGALATADAAARLKGRPTAVVTEIVAALDEWAGERRRQLMPREKWQPLADLAAAMDDGADSRRRQVRDILGRGNLYRERVLGTLAMALRPVPVPFDAGLGEDRSRLRQLAGDVEVANEPVLGLLLLARALLVAGDGAGAERLLRAAVRARPQEVVLQYELGKLLARRPMSSGEAVECYAAARALRPELGDALAWALMSDGRVAEGLALYRQLVTEKKDNPWLHFRLGGALLVEGRFKEAASPLLHPGGDANGALLVEGRFKEAEAAYREAIRLRPDHALSHCNLGCSLGQQGRHKEAETALREAIRLEPDLGLAHFNLGAVLFKQGRFKEAEAASREAIRLEPDHAPAHVNLGATLCDGQGRHKEAEAAFRQAIRLQPDFATAHYNLGVALFKQGRFKEAEAALREAIRLQPDYAVWHKYLGAALFNQGRFKEAEVADREAIRLQPDDAVSHKHLGEALFKQGRIKEAEAAYRKAIELDPKDAGAHYNLGAALYAKKDLDGAIAEFRKAIELDPKDAHAHFNLGRALHDNKDLDGAIAAYRKAIDLDSKHAHAHTNLGSALYDKKDLDGAIAEYRKAIDLEPKEAYPHNNLGAALYAKQDVDGAIAEYRKAIELDPKAALAHNNLGAALYVKRELDGAIAEYRKAIELEPKDVPAHNNLGHALSDKKDWAGAVAEFRTVIELDPRHADAHGNLGWLLDRRGRREEAVAESRAAIRLNPRVGWYHNNLGWSLQHLGRLAEAADEYRLALRCDPGHAQARANLGNLEPLLPLLPRLDAVRRGEARPSDAAEGLIVAQFCGLQGLNAAAAHFYADGFAADPRLTADLNQGHRYSAACHAALAAAGQAEDANNLPDKVQRMLRRQALAWLRADLALYAKLAEREEPAAKQAVRERLTHWQEDTDLASVRDRAALDPLPDDERQGWRQLWDDVAALLKKVEAKK